MIGRTNTGCGGGGLTFKVVGYATESALLAATPADNTIGIVTTNKITAWVISAEQPASMLDGGVWISTGTNSTVVFNALKAKTNAILVCPVTAMQFVSGSWVDLTAKSYQNGKWVDWWNGDVVFDRENQSYDSIFGCIHFVGSYGEGMFVDAPPCVKFCDNTGGSPRAFQWEMPFDMTKYKTLEVTGYSTLGTEVFGIATSLKTGATQKNQVYETASMVFSKNETTHQLDVSKVTGTGYFGCYVPAKGAVYIKHVKLN